MNSLEEGEVEDSTTVATLPPPLPPPPAFNSLPPKPATNTNTAINSLSRPPLPPPSSSLSNWNRSHTHLPQKEATIYLSPDRNQRTHSRSRNRDSSSTNSYSQTQSNHPRSSSHSPSRTPTKRQRHLSRSPHPPLPPTHLNPKPQNKANLLTAELLSSTQKPHHQNNTQESSEQSSDSAQKHFSKLSAHILLSPLIERNTLEEGPTNIKSYELVEKSEQGSSSICNVDSNPDHPGCLESEEDEDEGGGDDCKTATKNDDGNDPRKSRVKAGMVVALKIIIIQNELDGLPMTVLQEIRILKSLDHSNIVLVIDISYLKGNLKLLKRGNTYMVL
ncbi:hypothetical protein Pst134EA_015927 [Puccinia striiformis f. sp. tritici]|uniref:hypothetical protein n=1 Tax=Puccinia striiformis f. sp. tritici TaxID=168172 RepID=UPI002008250E|nr:hypothetical protein Pst134EA_015927 [Puccinia striiformis f. sp. tritici]KAH9463846.1 hypothetical protein Pst134EA_015927 [Puccinia striiformis f. sp. tritici]